MFNLNEKMRVATIKSARIGISALVLSMAFLTIPSSSVSAHSPIFPADNHDAAHAYEIRNPAKSWAIYASLQHPDKADYYKFSVSKGARIEIALMAAERPSVSGFLPSFALLVPGSTQTSNLPSYIEVPAGYGMVAVDGKDPGQASYEPFSPGWLYNLADQTFTANESGTYYVVVYDNTHKIGNYGLPIGYIESFTPAEWLTIPYDVHQTYVWEGQNRFATYLPLILVMLIGGIAVWRIRRGKAPIGLSKWLAAFAGLAFCGTAAGTMYQMILAIGITGFSLEAIFTLIFVAIAIILGVFTLMYALQEKPALSTGRRVGLIIIGLLALLGWAGFYVGPTLVVLAALVPGNTLARN